MSPLFLSQPVKCRIRQIVYLCYRCVHLHMCHSGTDEHQLSKCGTVRVGLIRPFQVGLKGPQMSQVKKANVWGGHPKSWALPRPAPRRGGRKGTVSLSAEQGIPCHSVKGCPDAEASSVLSLDSIPALFLNLLNGPFYPTEIGLFVPTRGWPFLPVPNSTSR